MFCKKVSQELSCHLAPQTWDCRVNIAMGLKRKETTQTIRFGKENNNFGDKNIFTTQRQLTSFFSCPFNVHLSLQKAASEMHPE